VVYHDVLLKVEPERDLYLAVNEETFVNLALSFDRGFATLLQGGTKV
jgi:hypothetical protein